MNHRRAHVRGIEDDWWQKARAEPQSTGRDGDVASGVGGHVDVGEGGLAVVAGELLGGDSRPLITY